MKEIWISTLSAYTKNRRQKTNTTTTEACPFLKWAGGKTQLLDAIDERLPAPIKESGRIHRYVEPFVGGGAVFFHLQRRYEIGEAFLFDINRDLIVGYQVLKQDHEALIGQLSELETEFLGKSQEDRKTQFYQIRDIYNTQMIEFDYTRYSKEWIDRATFLIFLNKTCYNGLFRQNKKGEFNVPYGRYVNPTICDEENLRAGHQALQHSRVFCDEFTAAGEYIDNRTFVYFDPPYRPLNATSGFTGYFKDDFDDTDQRELAQFFQDMDTRGADLLLSNSDPQNINPEDTFFDDLYKGYRIKRVPAKRFINCDGKKRGDVNELLIRNY
ncbi:MAG TPA: DNA adenine methylase [bacterium]|nr:DNA adenine methylase [bacterium]